MMVYRFSAEQYKDDISGNGAGLFGGRWNSKGNPVLYTSNHISLAVLELLVHNKNYTSFKDPWLVSIFIPDTILPVVIMAEKLMTGWNGRPEYTQWTGDLFLHEAGSLMLSVPSSIIPQENNVLLNPMHAYFKKVRIADAVLFELDKRLLHQ